MFRASLRSVSDPLQHHVCFSCLARRFGAPHRLRQFHIQSALRNEVGNALPVKQTGEVPQSAPSGDSSKENRSKEEGNRPKNPKRASRKSPRSAPPKKPKSPRRKPKRAAQKASPPKENPPKDGLSHVNQQRNLANARESLEKAKRKANILGTAQLGTSKDAKKDVAEEGSGESMQLVTGMLGQRAQKTEDGGGQPGQLHDKAATRRKLSHISGFISGKDSGSLSTIGQRITALDVPLAPVPRLSFGLDRVLFNPGVYQLRDPRSRVYNFDPYLGQIMPVTEFDFNALKAYITSSKDETLREIAVKEKKKYVGSSSSMTSVLSHFHYLLSAWRPIDTRTVSQGFPDKLKSFTRMLRAPAAMFLHYQDGVYAIDADKEFDTANILMNLGKSMEKLLTLPKEDFERYRRTHENKISAEEEQAIPESYHFSTYGDFIMRSQLDAHDPRLPGTGMFDLKTRAVVSIRMDAKNFEHGIGYEIKSRFGGFESYEREFYDMIRAAFLKYSLQVRVGRMDGIFVAFHNVERIFGFQYISLPEMDQALHGQSDTTLGDSEFQLSLGIWNKVLDKATARFPEKSLRFHFETRDAVTPFMYIFAEPVTQEDIHAIQTKNKAAIEAYQQRLLNLTPQEDDTDLESDYQTPSESEPEPEPEPTSETTSETSQEETPKEEHTETEKQTEKQTEKPLLAMALTIRNKVNGQYVERPMNLTKTDEWVVEYEISELGTPQGHTLYRMCQARRQKEMMGRGEDELDVAGNGYIRRLRQIAKQGRAYRARENELDKELGVVVLDDPVK